VVQFQAFYHHSKWKNFAESYTQNEIFDRSSSTGFCFGLATPISYILF